MNTNDSPYGLADNPDYIIVYGQSGLSRYDDVDYDIMQQGAIYILKPQKYEGPRDSLSILQVSFWHDETLEEG